MKDKHTFQFSAHAIAEAAQRMADYHSQRLAYWEEEYQKSLHDAMNSAKVTYTVNPHTGGHHTEITALYDLGAGRRMREAEDKVAAHFAAREKYKVDAALYETQHMTMYELGVDDVHYFHLAGEPLEA
jgi:hypothetical protein